MNKYQKAIDELLENVDYKDYSTQTINKVTEAIVILQELVNKATPQTVIPKWKEGYDPELYSPYALYCPRCNRKLRLDQFYKWCPDCNQKLNRYVSKWELENEKED